MNRMWILAAYGGEFSEQAGEIITSEDSEGQVSESTSQDAGTGEETPRPAVKPFFPPWAIIPLMVVLMYMMLFRGPRKKQKEQKKMVKSLAKNDRVRTIGGILGTVIDVRDDEITLKVDESNNTKIKVTPSAIGSVLLDDRSL